MGSQEIVLANVRRLMKKKGWTVDHLADFSGLSRSHIYELFRDRPHRNRDKPTSMTLRTLDQLAEALEVEPSELIKK